LIPNCIAVENKSEGRGETRTKKEIEQVEASNAAHRRLLALYCKTRARVEGKQEQKKKLNKLR